ncbi:MAG: glycosyltransferase family 39 protein [Acidobacteriota bacterium]|nr:glycosyltransferase family 39 protein [Acidobacteriota bacterium]
MRIRPIPSTLLATLTAALALLPLLGRKPLTDWDEAIYAQVSREMLHHSWLIPHWNTAVWLEKPPLMLWITAAFFHFFGVTEFWARAASALSGVAVVGILHLWLARTRSTLAAWLSTLMLLGTFGFLHSCHTGEMDITLALCCTIALIGLAQVEVGHDFGWLLFWAGFALAAMTKGAASVTLPITAAILTLVQRLRLRAPFLPFFGGLVLCLAIAVPWHLAMLPLFGRGFLREYLGLHILTRATQQIEGHVTPWWFYLKVLLVAAPPFVLLYPAAIAQALRRNSGLRAFAIFALTTLVFFSAVQTRLPQYIVPMYPALAAITAVWLADRVRTILAAPRWKLAAAAVLAALCIWLTMPARKSLHSATAAGLPASDSKDSTALLRNRPQPGVPESSPLLVWHDGPLMSMPSIVFYAGRPVEQVQFIPRATWPEPNRYTFNPQPATEAFAAGPRLLLVDRALISEIPSGFLYTPIASHGALEIGILTINH